MNSSYWAFLAFLLSPTALALDTPACGQFFSDFSEHSAPEPTSPITYSLEQRVPLGLACAQLLTEQLESSELASATEAVESTPAKTSGEQTQQQHR